VGDDRVWTALVVLVFLGIALYGCDRKTWTEDEIKEIVRTSSPAAYEGGNTQLTMDSDAEIKKLKTKVKFLQTQIDGLAKTVNSNVQIERNNMLNQATYEGKCGKGWVKRKDGSQYYGNIPCTAEDLWGDD